MYLEQTLSEITVPHDVITLDGDELGEVDGDCMYEARSLYSRTVRPHTVSLITGSLDSL